MISPAGIAGRHVAMVTFLSTGHVAPMLALATAFRQKIYPAPMVTVYIVASRPRAKKTTWSSAPIGVTQRVMELDLVELPNTEPMFDYTINHEPELIEKFWHFCLEDLGSRGAPKPACFIYDLFVCWAQVIAARLGAHCYAFMPSPLLMLDGMVDWVRAGDVKDPNALIPFGMLGKVPRSLLPGPSPSCGFFDTIAARVRCGRGMIVNDLRQLYPGKMERADRMRLWNMGWLQPQPGPTAFLPSVDKVAQWLSDQKDESVIYVALGSWCHPKCSDLCELAFALELTGRPFLWARRPKPVGWKFQTAFGPPEDDICRTSHDGDGLPVGWKDRVGNRGLVVPWASQVSVLASGKIGVFVSHCGWNSIVESFTAGCGVPIAALPLGAEQCLNALYLEEGLEVAQRIWPCPHEHKLERKRVAEVISEVAEDPKLRERAQAIHTMVTCAWDAEGSSQKALHNFLEEALA